MASGRSLQPGPAAEGELAPSDVEDPGALRTLDAPPSDGAVQPADATAPGAAGTEGRAPKRKGRGSSLREFPLLLAFALILALVIKTFLVQAFYIPSESMTNTLQVGDRVLVNKLVYHFHPPRIGDVIVFAEPHPSVVPHRGAPSAFWHWLTAGLGVSTSPDKDFIKRVIGLPGDRVEIRKGQVFVNGTALAEPYLNPVRDTRDFGPITVPKDQLFVMGDNRTNSLDSRFQLGYIPYDKVVGRAFVIVWPPSRVGWLHRT